MNEDARRVPMPPRVKALPRGPNGYPIPWFVPTLPDGRRDARLASVDTQIRAITQHRCWVCGVQLGRRLAFVLGPVSVINRKTTEPAMHRDCAEYALQVCPFLTDPAAARRVQAMPAGALPPAGVSIPHNPGGAAVWITDTFTPRHPPGAAQIIVTPGPARSVSWWKQGRAATAAEAAAILDVGLRAILDNTESEYKMMLAAAGDDPTRVDAARADRYRARTYTTNMHAAAMKLLPAG